MTNIEHKPKTAEERVIHAAHEAMIRQIILEGDNLDSKLAAKMATARLLTVTAIIHDFRYDTEQMDWALSLFIEQVTEHLNEAKIMLTSTKH